MPGSPGSADSSAVKDFPSKKVRTKATDVLVVTLLPWLVFSLIVCLFTFSSTDLEVLVWGLVAMCLFLALLFIILGKTRGLPIQLAVGVLAFGAVVISVPVGISIESQYMAEYWRLDAGASYKNLRASEAGAAHQDATMLHFVAGTAVVLDKSLGYMKAGNVFCVAPIASGTITTSPQFWAVGEDCCDQRGGFTCNDAEDKSALTAIVVSSGKERYTDAVRMAESVYGLGPFAGQPVLVHWTKDASGYRDGLWWSATILVVCASLVHLLASGFAGAILTRVMQQQQQKLPGK
mmetsp:Transcript_44410/g.96519  ORF Transcript_44410/g.96519 Transcript_44410/m.96519 type:complete len:292 (-) Transcript_44410:126-1001(-)|eukprot:CAMPEP_0170601560 /NCGR_PEP_ID=MMETSP0224-20130122/17926_1 /TAXON_ID=285029 /ORGANISM="Togula jolla, Strain CCCM 725" /LENGTH=291 /DNA_ID=CAMNT_0010926347 /DNA_START=114 /DNA_END=989 /DNA_ORIENTATION=-